MTGNFTDVEDLDTLRSQAPIMQNRYTTLGQQCLQRSSGKYLPFIGTAATVRDLVALANTLDGEGSAINYIGLSYGTILGSQFINMFPEVYSSLEFQTCSSSTPVIARWTRHP